MPSLSSNVSAVLDLAGGSSTDHPNIIGKTARVVNQIARMMMREARLSEQNQYLRFLTLNSPAKESGIPSISDVNSIVMVELLTDSVSDVRCDVQIVDRLDLNLKEDQGRYACARFGNPTRIRFSWNPSESSETIYVGYEALPTDADQMSSIPSLPESFHDVLQFRSAALIKETVLGQACTPVFLDTMNRAERQWEKWAMRDAEERPMQKPGFGDLDMDDAMEVWF